MNLDENDNIQELESSWSLIKEQEEGYVFFSAGSGVYTWGERLWTIFSISLVSVLLFVMVIVAYKAIITESLVEKLVGGGLAILIIIGFLQSLYEQLLEFKDQLLELIHSNSHLVLTRDYLEVYWSPIKILKQKILIKNIESIDLEWQRFLLVGKKIPIEEGKRKLAKDSSYESQGYSSFKVNLRNKKSKTLNFKLRKIDVAEQLSTYILSPHEFSTTDFKTNEDGTVVKTEEEKLIIYSSELLLNEQEMEESRNILKSSVVVVIILITLCVGRSMRGKLEVLSIGILFFPAWAKNLYLLLKNARIKKIEVTPSLLTESRIGFKKKAEFSKEAINSFFVKRQEKNKNYFISIILKEGIAHDLSVEFKERKTAEELIEKIKMCFANENKIPIDLKSNASLMDSTDLEEDFREELDDEKDAAG